MDTNLIRQELKKRNVTMADIARALQVSDVAVWLVIKGTSKSARITKAIEEVLSQPVPETDHRRRELIAKKNQVPDEESIHLLAEIRKIRADNLKFSQSCHDFFRVKPGSAKIIPFHESE